MLFQAICRLGGPSPGFTTKIMRVMRLTAFFLVGFALQISAKTLAQSITYAGKDVSLETVFGVIEKQTGYVVFYDYRQITGARPVSVSARNEPLVSFLNRCFKNQPFGFAIEDKTIMITKLVAAPASSQPDPLPVADFPVKVLVINKEGQPLAGASVTAKRSRKAGITGAGGHLEMNVAAGDVLVITYVGYESQEIAVREGVSPLTVILKPANSKLDEVQVVAYGTVVKRMNTGNVSTVSAAEIERQPVNNPLYALQGRVPGLMVTQASGIPGSWVNVRIRGRNGINEGTPLLLVDGLPYDNELSNIGGPNNSASPSGMNFIDPHDIESIEVLKDASATAIYGSRGANGVILVTTKKGKGGMPKIDLDIQSGWGTVTRRVDLLDTEQYLAMRKEMLKNEGIDMNAPPYTDYPFLRPMNYPDLYYWDQDRYTDWQKEILGGPARYHDVRASISGGTLYARYLIGATFHKETSVFPGNSGDQKANVHFSLSTSSADQKLKAAITASYMKNWTDFPKEDLTKYIQLPPNAPAMTTADGGINWEPLLGIGFDEVQIATFANNPIAKNYQYFKANTGNLTASAELSYSVLPQLLLRITAGYNDMRRDAFTAVNPDRALPPGFWESNIQESAFNFANGNSLIVEPQAVYNTGFGKNNFELLAGGSYQSSRSTRQYIAAVGFNNDDLMENMGSANEQRASNSSLQYKYNAVFARLKYNYNKKYLVDLNARRDGSSRFGPGKQFGNFGSVGAAWIFSSEPFLERLQPALSFGKLRVSYGSTGSDAINDYAYLERYANVTGTYQGVKGFRTLGLFNSYYAWELTRKLEVGLELGFLEDHIVVEASFYRNRSSNQLIRSPLPGMAGPGADLVMNMPALVENKGMEYSLSTINVQKKHFEWRSNFNISFNKNKLLKYPGIEKSTAFSELRVGEPLELKWVFDYKDVDPATGLYRFIDRNGNITSAPDYSLDRVVPINIQPEYYGGLQNSLRYKNLTLDFLFQFVKQTGYNYLFTFESKPGDAVNQPVEVLDRWQKEGDIAKFQKFIVNDWQAGLAYSNASRSEQAYSDASFIRLKNLSLSYSLPDRWRERMRMKQVRVFMQGQNLLTFTSYKGLDPETQNAYSLPPLRILTAGLHLTF